MSAGAPNLHEQVVLTFSASKLPSMDLTSKSDPMLILYAIDPLTKRTTRISRTEYIMNNEDPKWAQTYQTNFYFEKEQRFKIEVYDIDGIDSGGLNVDVSGFDYMGSCEFLLSHVMSAYSCTHTVQLTGKDGKPVHQTGLLSSANQTNRSLIHIRGDQLVKTRHKAYFDVSATDLSKGSFFGKDDTEFQFVKKRSDGSDLSIYSSKMVYQTQNPVWGEGKIDLGQLVDGGDPNSTDAFMLRAVRIKEGKRETIGQSIVKLSDMKQGITFTLNDVKGKDRGKLLLKKWKIEEEFTFLDYIGGGLDFSMQICIDFTGSNKEPHLPDSLHYIHQGCRNQYIDAIRSIGTIVSNYCGKSVFPVVGFGGFVSIDGRQQDTSHCFPLSLSSNNPFCNGIEDVIKTYCTSLPRITLSGPTYFENIIRAGTVPALRPYTPDYQHYNIICIFTDGIINDMAKTIDAIIDAAKTPVSIIIVGVSMVSPGGVSLTDFSAMDQLDGDEQRLKSPTKGECPRDIVQFVPFLKYMNNPQLLAEEVLAEVPTQIAEFMNMHKIKPVQRKPPGGLDQTGNPIPYQDGGNQQY